MKVGVTGGAGFIGSYVVERLLSLGHDVVIFDRRGRVPELPWSDQMETFLGDVTDWTAVSELFAHVDGVIHLAACLGTQETIADPEPAFRTNGLGGLNVAKAALKYGKPVVNICVGNWWMDNSYAITKTTAERVFRMFNNEHGTKINQVRVVNAYGPRQSVAAPYGPAAVRKILPSFICRALTGAPLEVYGSGQQISDMVYVGDVAKALVASLELAGAGRVFPRPVEVGPLKSLTVNQIAEIVRESVSHQFGIAQQPIVHLPMRPGEEKDAKITADTTTLDWVGMRASELLPFGDGLDLTASWFYDNWLPVWNAELAAVGG